MARKCDAPGCGFNLPDKYPLTKCPWHMAPGQGPVKIAAALAIAAAGLGGGFAYKKFRTYLNEKKLRRRREESRQRQMSSAAGEQQKAASLTRKRSVTRKRPRARKKSAPKSKQKTAEPKVSEDLS
jgi:hypothetical protein